jgi:hypothetical protein
MNEAQVIREALENGRDYFEGDEPERIAAYDALAALDALEARVEELEEALRGMMDAFGWMPNADVQERMNRAWKRGVAVLSAVQENEKAQQDMEPDPGSFGGHPYSRTERALGYGTDHDPRFQEGEK